jgi:hypothetical protein
MIGGAVKLLCDVPIAVQAWEGKFTFETLLSLEFL